MLPITLLAAQKAQSFLTQSDALSQTIATLASDAGGAQVPPINSTQVVLSSVSPDIGDKDVQLTYPRVCLYSSGLKNTQAEKFRSVSGTVSVVAEVWASGNMVTQTDQWIHFYVEAVTEVLGGTAGDWGDGLFFSGLYDVQFQAPKAGGFGYVQSAKVSCTVNVSRN
ncbi:MAG TPA: hypothetical protein VKV79_02530 [Terriglobia bacterium]|nr:hypothetical protein [Terriglobia bacterium]